MMMTKIKKLLVSFGYRKIDNFIYMKPMGFVSMVAKIEEEKIILFSQFTSSFGEHLIWYKKEIKIPELIEMEFNEMSRNFAFSENEVYHTVYSGEPSNIITSTEIEMIEQGVL